MSGLWRSGWRSLGAWAGLHRVGDVSGHRLGPEMLEPMSGLAGSGRTIESMPSNDLRSYAAMRFDCAVRDAARCELAYRDDWGGHWNERTFLHKPVALSAIALGTVRG